jgi:hypothetical protein
MIWVSVDPICGEPPTPNLFLQGCKMKYSVQEIDKMRVIIKKINPPNHDIEMGMLYGHFTLQIQSYKTCIEETLRTYMFNGTTVAELEQSLKEPFMAK